MSSPRDDGRSAAAAPVQQVGPWAVGTVDGERFAVSRRCRHQFADLSGGAVDASGCLVCPWHESRYDPRTGVMVSGPRGFLSWHGPTPGYSRLVLALGRRLPLRLGEVTEVAGRLVVRRRTR
jgi:nitrite reductase/ring-hydroxylating ferredoxin subunit